MANCGKCGGDIRTCEYNGLRFDICKNCGAIIISKENFDKLVKMIDENCAILDLFSLKPVKTKESIITCHHCNKPMVKIYYEGVLLDRCDKCKTLYFDNGELSKYFSKFGLKNIEIMSNPKFIKTYCSTSNEVTSEDSETKTENNNKKEVISMEIQSKEIEKRVPSSDGWTMVAVVFFIFILALVLIALACFMPMLSSLGILGGIIVGINLWLISGFKIVAPQEAIVFTLFGKYYGTLRNPGFYWVNPFAAVHNWMMGRISLKARTLDNARQKINDVLGNPIEVGIMVTWEVKDTARAVFNVNDYQSFLSAQCDSALRNIVRMYPYDAPEDSGKQSLKGDSAEISDKLKIEIQERVKVAGLNIIDARITHLAYSSEIAMAMLQRQQANAVLDAKRTIVEGAVGMVEMAINRLSQNENIKLDDKTKASMVNNLLVVLCSSRESQPVVRNDIL